MSAVSPLSPPNPAYAPPPVDSDFYRITDLLTKDERAVLARVRAFMETEVAPIINEYWSKAKFPFELVPKLRNLGIGGPYGIALGPRCYVGLTETTTGGGYRVYDHVKRLLNGPLVWTPGIDGAIVLSVRGGDFELTVGEDLSIGYLGHSADKVRLYLQESLTFRVLTAEAAIPLRYCTG